QYYIPHRQFSLGSMFLVVRTTSQPKSLAAAVRGVIQTIDKDLPVFNVTTLEQMVADSMAQRRFSLLLLGVFAAVALLLAAVGLYGVMTYAVTQRTHEIGVRMALGAQTADVVRLVVRQGMTLAIIGVAIGLAAALGLTRWMAALLFGVRATDAVTFTGV